MDLDFTADETARYARNVQLDEIGQAGQALLRAARVLVVGAGGLGSPLLLYLAAAGVGRITVADDDAVDLSNLNRQILHTTASVGEPKARSAVRAVRALNPEVAVTPHVAVNESNAAALAVAHDVVCDGSDNFATRFTVADAAWAAGTSLVSAAVNGWDGQLGVFARGGPCYRCLNPAEPPPGSVRRCSETGVLGTTTGILGVMQANEAIKLILGVGETLAGRLLIWDGFRSRIRVVGVPRDPGCPGCGDQGASSRAIITTQISPSAKNHA